MKNYHNKLEELRNEIINDIKDIINNKGKQINIPFYYDEDDYDADIDTLIEDDYDVCVGSEYDNINVVLCNYCGFLHNVTIIALKLNNNGKIDIISKNQNIYPISDVYNTIDLIKIYDAIK